MTLARLKQAILSLKILDGIMSQSEERPSGIGFVNRPVVSGDFAFQNVTFRYPRTDTDVLNKVSFAVKTGERVGIIGKIGSGKTTLGRILTNLYSPADGRILINGIDARQYHPAELRSAIAYVGQTVDLFTGTLKYNLQLANPGASDQELIEAAQKTGVDEFAMQHPRGYDLMVGERGSSLSGGQRQAVALTRLLLAKPKIVFLDEPSGSLDLATERRLIGNLARIFGPDVSLVISTHRYSLLELVDRLIVLDRGNIVADGPKDKVLEAMKAQARSVQAQ
ncbi:ATP-binding cassette domain-containing protein [Roseibium salinum]